ncbi:MAG: GNAT family N-acetyltransferase [Verrucomicrobiales bacterium]|nr:GNAT family N-acetyltransferase [Verrucomicrobiales bacterium]
MGDLLVKLYDLPKAEPLPSGFRIKRPLAPEKRTVVSWVEERFGDRWASETELAFSRHPLTCFVALDDSSNLIGFACYDTSFKGFFGPTGVDESFRGKGIGTVLLIRSLEALRESGYAYAIIGYSGADDYYGKTVGAIPIEGSEPGPYRDWIRRE